MRYEGIADGSGSFWAYGDSFNFFYDATNKVLQVLARNETEPVMFAAMSKRCASDPFVFAILFEKTTQLKAMMYSGNETLHLSEAVDRSRLAALLENVLTLTHHAFDLKEKRYDRFAHDLAMDCDLHTLRIERVVGSCRSLQHFSGHITTHNGNSITARASSLANALSKLSEKTVSELIALEFGKGGFSLHASPHNLLRASSKLATLGRVLDRNFVPRTRLVGFEQNLPSEPAKSAH